MQEQPPTGSGPPAMRAADADRERIATVLQENYEEGRLTLDELQDRLKQAYAARTLTELSPLTADLPSHPIPAASPAVPIPDPSAPQRPRAAQIRDRVVTYVILMVFLIAVWAASGHHGSFWPIWPIIVGAFILAGNIAGIDRRENRRRARDQRRAMRHRRRDG